LLLIAQFIGDGLGFLKIPSGSDPVLLPKGTFSQLTEDPYLHPPSLFTSGEHQAAVQGRSSPVELALVHE
jgi:hypothetical protein